MSRCIRVMLEVKLQERNAKMCEVTETFCPDRKCSNQRLFKKLAQQTVDLILPHGIASAQQCALILCERLS